MIDVADVAIILGLAAIFVGFWLFDFRAGIIAVGVFLLAFGVARIRATSRLQQRE